MGRKLTNRRRKLQLKRKRWQTDGVLRGNERETPAVGRKLVFRWRKLQLKRERWQADGVLREKGRETPSVGRKLTSVFWQKTERQKSLLAEHGSTDQNCTQDEANMRILAVE
ncbi:MAG: hypothetical protein IIZ76_07710 [Clostridia bacterium]|nr:hypothetical protein [Clostridia bacterium]